MLREGCGFANDDRQTQIIGEVEQLKRRVASAPAPPSFGAERAPPGDHEVAEFDTIARCHRFHACA